MNIQPVRLQKLFVVSLLLFLPCITFPQGLFINEFMASNSTSIIDNDYKNYADWIEIYNSGSSPVNLKNYYLTDDFSQPQKYKIQIDLIVESNGYVLFWADDYNTGRHTNFKLGASGESIGLYDPTVQLVDTLTFGSQQNDISAGRFPSGADNWVKFSPSSPGTLNIQSNIFNLLSLPSISLQSGFYTSPQVVSVSHNLPGVSIYYTGDGSTPTSSSKLFSLPIHVDSTSVLRFRAFKNGYSPSIAESRTYFINEKTDLPVFSLVTDPSNFFSDATGIYVAGTNGIIANCSTQPRNWNQDWERPISLEFFESNKLPAFKINAGVKIDGGCSRLYAEKSLSIFMRGEYGLSKLDYRLLFDVPFKEYNNFNLRSGGQDWWRTMFRDEMVQTLLKQGMKLDCQDYRPSILFINGKYWGIHNIREKLNEHYTYYHHGVNKDNIDLIEISKGIVANNGDLTAYNSLTNFLNSKSLTDPANYEYIKSIIDMDEYIDYQTAQIYSANGDWPGSNTKLWRERIPSGKWRWMVYDLDFTFGGNAEGMAATNTLAQATSANGPSWPNPPWATLMFRKLLENSDFKNEFIQRFAAHMNTTFEPNHVLAVIDSMALNIASEVPRHKLRWPQSISFAATWKDLIDVMRNFAVNRPANVRSHFYSKFGISSTVSIVINRNNPQWGKVFTNSVEIKKNESSNLFFKDIPVRIIAVPLPGYRFVKWDGTSNSTSQEISITPDKNSVLTALFEPAQLKVTSIVINEINYKSSPVLDTEDWVELYNPDSQPVNLSGWKFRDDNIANQFILPDKSIIGPKDYLIICRDSLKFKSHYPGVKKITGNMNIGLSSDAEHLLLINSSQNIVDEVSFSSIEPWVSKLYGTGSTLALINPQLDNSKAENWKPSKLYGTPGYLNDVYTKTEREINFIPNEFALFQNYPNPFNPNTAISYQISAFSHVTLKIYDLLGREIITLVDEYQQAGSYNFQFSLGPAGRILNSQLPSGIYFYNLKSGSYSQTKKMVLTK